MAILVSLLVATPAMARMPTPAPPSSPEPWPQHSPPPAPAPPAPTVTAPVPDHQAGSRQRERRKPSLKKKQRQKRQEQRRQRKDRQRERTRIERSCAEFSHTQTYLGWGPALSYGEPVTVVYGGDRCTRPRGVAAEVRVDGSATVYRGATTEGEPIDGKPFRMMGTWNRPSNQIAWPLTWWGCGVKLARYTWEIPGVYTFDVGARWGVWTLTVSTQPVSPPAEPRTVHWSYNGC